MRREDFCEQLHAQGFRDLVEVKREPDGQLDLHSHAFESKGLILDGMLTLIVKGEERVYQKDEIFHLPYATPHLERYGPNGVRYLVGRK